MRNKKVIAIDVNTGVKETIDDSIKAKQRSQSKEQKDTLMHILKYAQQKNLPVRREGEDGAFAENMVIVGRFALGTKKDVEYLFAILKTTLHIERMRQYRILALALASMNPIIEVKDLFRRAFQSLIVTEEDLCEFTTVIKSNNLRGYGKVIQKATTAKLKTLPIDQYLFAAQRTRVQDHDMSSRDQRTDSFKLSDVIKLAHVKPETDQEKALFKALIKGDMTDANLPPQYTRYIEYTLAQDERKAQILEEIPFSVDLVMANRPGKRAAKWACLHSNVLEIVRYFKMFYDFELMTHDAECIRHVCQTLSDENKVLEAKLIPTTYLSLTDSFPYCKNQILAALYGAGEISYANMLPIDGKFLMFVNQSIPMEHTIGVSMTRQVSLKLLANTMCSILYKKASDAEIIPYTRKVESISLDKSMSTVAISDLLTQGYRGASVDNLAPFKYLNEHRPQAKHILFINADRAWPNFLLETEAGLLLSQYLSSLDYAPTLYFINMANGSAPRANSLQNSFFVPQYSKDLMPHILQHVSNHTEYSEELDTIVF
jgi:hypothetical protein